MLNLTHINQNVKLADDQLHILTLNIHSIINKLYELESFINNFKVKPQIIIITETWLKEHHGTNENFMFNLAGYQCTNFPRPAQKSGGGICLYIQNGISFNVIHSHELLNSQHLVVRLLEQNLSIGAIYRAPDTNIEQYLDWLDSDLEKFPRCIWSGDLNINLLARNNIETARVNKYNAILASNNFHILNCVTSTNATYYHPLCGFSILDHAFTDTTFQSYNSFVQSVGFSDHDALIVSVNLNKAHRQNDSTIQVINYGNLNKEIQKSIKASNSVDELSEKIEFSIERCTSTRSLKKNDPDWLSSDIKRLMNQRDFFKKQSWRHRDNNYFLSRYKDLQRQVTRLIRTSKKQKLHENLMNCGGDAKKTWRILNQLIFNKDGRKSENIVELIDDNDRALTDSVAINDYVSKYFTTIGDRIALNQNSTSMNPMSLVKSNNQSMLLSAVTLKEVLNIIGQLKNSSAPGPDKITTKMIKENAASFAPFFTEHINRSFSTGQFPKSLKIARGCIIFKSGDKRRASNYRPISVLNIFAKIWERALCNRMLTFLKDTEYLSKTQYGFLATSNTSAAATDFVDLVLDSLNRKELAISLFIDVSKAFDSVNHKLLLAKLNVAGFQGPTIKLLQNYLCQRSFYTCINNVKSSQKLVKSGVPQGSILAPLLFLIFVNDLGYLQLQGCLKSYADDTAIVYRGKNLTALQIAINNDLKLIYSWFIANKLSINTSKTSFMIFSSRGNKTDTSHFTLEFDPLSPLTRVRVFKYLGLWLDEHLSWTEHIKKVTAKIAPFVGILARIKHIAHQKSLLQIYYAHIHSHLIYMCHIWSMAAAIHLRTLEVLQNKAMRRVFSRDYQDLEVHTTDLYKKHSILPIKQLGTFNLLLTTHKMVNGLQKTDIAFTRNEHHSHNTRTKGNLYLPQSKNNYGSNRTEVRGGKLYNSLDAPIKKAPSIAVFKKLLKIDIISHL